MTELNDYQILNQTSREGDHKTDYPMLLFPRLALLLGGSNEAAFVAQLHYWIEKGGHTREDGQRWIWNSVRAWLQQFVWLTKNSLDCVIRKLEKLNVVISDKPRQRRGDQTKWYRLNYEKLAEIGWNPYGYSFPENQKCSSGKSELHFPKTRNAVLENQKSLTETTFRDYDPEITLSPPTSPQEKEREKNEQKCLEQEQEANQSYEIPEGTSTAHIPATVKDKPKIREQMKGSQEDHSSGRARTSPNSDKAMELLNHPVFLQWWAHRVSKTKFGAEELEMPPEAYVKARIRKNPDQALDMFAAFQDEQSRRVDNFQSRLAAGINISEGEREEIVAIAPYAVPVAADPTTALSAIAPTHNPTAAPSVIAPSAAAPACNLTASSGAIAPSAVAPINSYKDADENPDAYRLFSAEALSEASPMPEDIKAKINQLIGKRSISPMPPRSNEPPAPIFVVPPTPAEACERWVALPEHREQMRKELEVWDLEIVDGGVLREIPF